MGSAESAVEYLQGLASDLAAEYPRPALSGRIEQIRGLASNLSQMIAHLPEEEMREADYAERLLKLHDAGYFDANRHPVAAQDRLEYALGARDDGGSE